MPKWWIAMLAADAVAVPLLVAVVLHVRREQARLFERARTRGALRAARCLMQIGVLQSPGVVHVDGDVLVLEPVLGRRRELPLAGTVLLTRRARWARGAWWPGRQWLRLRAPDGRRVSLSVADPAPWRALFERRGDVTDHGRL